MTRGGYVLYLTYRPRKRYRSGIRPSLSHFGGRFHDKIVMMFKWKKPKNNLDVDIRFLLANERTLLAWIRTGLTLIAGGVAVAFVATDSTYGTIAGLGAITFGGLLALVGYIRYRVADAAIREGKLPGTGVSSLLLVIGVIVFAFALLMVKEMHLL